MGGDTILYDINNKIAKLQTNIVNRISYDNKLSNKTITNDELTIPTIQFIGNGTKIVQDFDNEQTLHSAYVQLQSRNIFPSAYKVGDYIIKKGMRPIELDGFKYSINELGGLVVELIADAVSDKDGSNLVTYRNVGIDFSDYPAPSDWRSSDWREDMTKNDSTFPYKRPYNSAYAFPLSKNKKYYFHCATNYIDLNLPQPTSNSIVYETYKENYFGTKTVYFQIKDTEKPMVPPIKF
jgi:hypothetical protein